MDGDGLLMFKIYLTFRCNNTCQTPGSASGNTAQIQNSLALVQIYHDIIVHSSTFIKITSGR